MASTSNTQVVPVFKLPPPRPRGETKAFIAFVNKYGGQYKGLRQYAAQIAAAAKEFGVDPVYFASLLIAESGVRMVNGGTGGRMVGLGQLNPDTFIGIKLPGTNRTVTAADLKNPLTNLRLSALYLRQGLDKGYSYANVYSSYYNPRDPNRGKAEAQITGRVPKDYLPGVSSPGTTVPQGPTQKAQSAVEVANARQAATDPWVVIDRNGKPKFVFAKDDTSRPPAGALKTPGGAYVTRNQFFTFKQQLDSIYVAYTGKPSTLSQAANVLRTGVSDYALKQKLSESPGFVKSPLYKAQAPEYEAAYKAIYGPDAAAPSRLIAKAIGLGQSVSAFQQTLRDRPDYETSEEFKASAAVFENDYKAIYGPDQAADPEMVKEAIRHGWTRDQWQGFLRARPEYDGSEEFKSVVASLTLDYKAVMGPDEDNQALVQAAAKAGWTRDQLNLYLRSQPEYASSQEFQAQQATLAGVYASVYGNPDEKGQQTIDYATRQGWTPEQFSQYLRQLPEYATSSAEVISGMATLGQILSQWTGRAAPGLAGRFAGARGETPYSEPTAPLPGPSQAPPAVSAPGFGGPSQNQPVRPFGPKEEGAGFPEGEAPTPPIPGYGRIPEGVAV